MHGPAARPHRLTARAALTAKTSLSRGDHFQGTVDLTGLPDLTVLAQLTVAGRTYRSALHWTILDATERIDDRESSEAGDNPELQKAVPR